MSATSSSEPLPALSLSSLDSRAFSWLCAWACAWAPALAFRSLSASTPMPSRASWYCETICSSPCHASSTASVLSSMSTSLWSAIHPNRSPYLALSSSSVERPESRTESHSASAAVVASFASTAHSLIQESSPEEKSRPLVFSPSPSLVESLLSLSKPASPALASEAASVESASMDMASATSLTSAALSGPCSTAPVSLPMASAKPLMPSTTSEIRLSTPASTGDSTCPILVWSSSIDAERRASAPDAVLRLADHAPTSSEYSAISILAIAAFFDAASMLALQIPAFFAASSKDWPAMSFLKASSLPSAATLVTHSLIWSSEYHLSTAERSYLSLVSSWAYSSAALDPIPDALSAS